MSEATERTCADCGMALSDEVKTPKSRKKYSSEIKLEELRRVLHYDPSTGIFTRLVTLGGPKGKVGDKAGSLKTNGYVSIRYMGKMYKAHRLAWLYHYGVWPKDEIDHINGKKSDNRIENLREATKSQNGANIGRRTRNTTGFIGVSRAGKRFAARITLNRKVMALGCFATAEEAYQAYCKKAVEIHGEFANTDNNPEYLNKSGRR